MSLLNIIGLPLEGNLVAVPDEAIITGKRV